jgi:hypothetical protein
MANQWQSAMTSILGAINSAAAAGNYQAVSNLGGLLQFGHQAGHINYKDKTITVQWEQANQSTAALLLAQGWTIIPD